MRGSGGTDGGLSLFLIGLGLSALGVYLFFDSVRVTTGMGLISGAFGGRGGGRGFWETTSMAIIFVPFLIGVIVLFYDVKTKWAWWMMYLGIAVIAIEILSRIHFYINTKLTHLLGMMVLFASGIGLIMRSYRRAPRMPGAEE
ncbi:MAG: hypothetical protein OER86_06530 [Phycisphaerae bacterium]|nr:hypothetical protein [Phycisphaerae bacterium]